MKLAWGCHQLDFVEKTQVMGILNVTPDSFSDGGLHTTIESAVEHARKMVDEGADIIDIGGESSRPGSALVSADEELKRIIPVIEALSPLVTVPISIDTCKAVVAEKALQAGAAMVNDISGMRADPDMVNVVREFRVPVVLMHMQGIPRSMQDNPYYDDLIEDIREYFTLCIQGAVRLGIQEHLIILDPGIGFGKTFEHNLMLLNRLEAFSIFGRPVMVGPSRKAFLGKILGDVPASDRLEGTAAAIAVAIMKGAHIIRVHDVKEMTRVARTTDAIKRERIAL